MSNKLLEMWYVYATYRLGKKASVKKVEAFFKYETEFTVEFCGYETSKAQEERDKSKRVVDVVASILVGGGATIDEVIEAVKPWLPSPPECGDAEALRARRLGGSKEER